MSFPDQAFNPFECLALEAGFFLDRQALEQNYLIAQFSHHPDRSPDPSFQEQSQRINQAYKILQCPKQRAQALLSLKNWWPAPAFPDLMEEILESRLCQDWEAKIQEAFKNFQTALDTNHRDLAQKSYWWIAQYGSMKE